MSKELSVLACCVSNVPVSVRCRGSPNWSEDVYCGTLHCIQIDGTTLAGVGVEVGFPFVLICSCSLGIKGPACFPDVL